MVLEDFSKVKSDVAFLDFVEGSVIEILIFD